MGSLSEQDWQSLWLTLRLACWTSVVLIVLGIPSAWMLALTRSRLKVFMEAIISLPLVLPPTVLGFYLLILLGPKGYVGSILQSLGFRHLAFSFEGLVIASTVFSFPFMVKPIQSAFEQLSYDYLEAAATLRATTWDAFFSIGIPLAWPSILTGIVLSFAHTIGEFGVALMVGGSIPGKTQVISITLYREVEMMAYANAHFLSLLLVSAALISLVCIYLLAHTTRSRNMPR